MHILIIGPSWVGDLVMSNSLLKHLKLKYPSAQIDVLAPAWCQAILTKMPEVSNIIHMPIGHGELNLAARKKIAQTLQSPSYDQAIVLPNSFKSALIPFWAKIPIRTGWLGEFRYGLLNDIRRLDTKKYPMMVMRYNALAFEATRIPEPDLLKTPYPHLVVNEETLKQSMARLKSVCPLPNAPFVALCPGAEYGPAKCWPYYHYASLSNQLIQQGYQICILGSHKDKAIAAKISANLEKENAEHCFDLTGKTHLNEVVDIMSQSQAVVSNDSGLMHIAAAINRPLVALYGPTSPEFTPPLSDKAKIIRLIDGYLRIRYTKDSEEGYHQSLIDIKPNDVFQKLLQMLSEHQ